MTPTDDLVPILKKLRLSGMLQTLELRTRQAVDDSSRTSEFLYRLLADEVERREAKQLDAAPAPRQLRARQDPRGLRLHLQPEDPQGQDHRPRHLRLRRAPGERPASSARPASARSHLAQALGHRACRRRLQRALRRGPQAPRRSCAPRAPTAATTASSLRFTSPDLLIIDDLGLRALRQEEPEDLYEIIRQRYERGAPIITSNRAIEEWPPLFGDALLASAAMDRLLHHAHVLVIEGHSYRNPRRRPKPAPKATPA